MSKHSSSAWLERLESIIQWEGQFNSQRLMQSLKMSRQSISKLVNQYQREHPQQLVYNASKKVYQIAPAFQPTRPCSLSHYLHNEQQAYGVLCHLTGGLKEPDPVIMRPVIQAIREQQRIDIRYISIKSPDFEERIISPHSLVFDGRRWHTRAWCEKNQAFRDFVLSRIHQVFALEGAAEKTQQDDQAWHRLVDFYIEAAPGLSQQQQRIIALDFGLEQSADGRYQRLFSVPEALVMYWLHYLRIDVERENAQAQQVILSPESQSVRKQYLPA